MCSQATTASARLLPLFDGSALKSVMKLLKRAAGILGVQTLDSLQLGGGHTPARSDITATTPQQPSFGCSSSPTRRPSRGRKAERRGRRRGRAAYACLSRWTTARCAPGTRRRSHSSWCSKLIQWIDAHARCRSGVDGQTVRDIDEVVPACLGCTLEFGVVNLNRPSVHPLGAMYTSTLPGRG